jgi:hypothetical protein
MKWSREAGANGKFQMVFHSPFALCHLNLEFLFRARYVLFPMLKNVTKVPT